jgi:hypothetical protein
MAQGVDPLITRADVQDFFPELKESEDERIRKGLIEFFKDWSKTRSHCWSIYIPDILAWLEKQGEQKLYVNDNAKEMFIKALERVEEQNAKGYKLTDCDKNSWWEDFKEYTTSEQILANSAKTCKDEQKSAWSEEDSARLQRIIDFLWYNRKGDTDTIYQQEQDIDWLKSLKDKYTWKPSDEQITVLELASKYERVFTLKQIDILIGLKEQLKKLTE